MPWYSLFENGRHADNDRKGRGGANIKISEFLKYTRGLLLMRQYFVNISIFILIFDLYFVYPWVSPISENLEVWRL